MKRSESLIKIAPALLKAQRAMGDATKSAKNPFFKSTFADLNSVREAVMPALNENGITVLQLTAPGEQGGQFVETTLLHESGEFIQSLTEIVCAKQNDPQALGSAMSYARRYGLQAALCVGAVDDDSEKAMGRNDTKQESNSAVNANGNPPAKAGVSFAPSKKTVVTKNETAKTNPDNF